MSDKNIWKNIDDYGGNYIVNKYGIVRSLPRYIRMVSKKGKECRRLINGRLLTQHLCGSGYLKINIGYRGKSKNIMVHRLVALAFVPNPDNKPEINHIDGDKTNNLASNLEWVTNSENKIHAYKSGLRKTGKEHHFSHMDRNEFGHCVT